MPIYVASKFEKLPTDAIVIDTTAKSGQWIGLSPFYLHGGPLYDGYIAQNVENGWQYAKVYAQHTDVALEPTDQYWDWARTGWAKSRADRYPMKKGAVPLYSLWRGERLGYIDARKRIYAPLYARAVVRTQAFRDLQGIVTQQQGDIYLRDYDGYNHTGLNMTISDVIHESRRKMGHAFVLWMLLHQYVAHGDFQADHWLASAGAPALVEIP